MTYEQLLTQIESIPQSEYRDYLKQIYEKGDDWFSEKKIFNLK